MIQSFPHRYKSKEPISDFFLKFIFKEVFWAARAVAKQ